MADGTLRDLGHDVRIVRADSDYDVKAEVQNFLWADVVFWQMPRLVDGRAVDSEKIH